MMSLLPRFKRLWLYVRGGIALIPSLWVIGFILFAFLMRYFEHLGLSDWLKEQGEFFHIEAADTARAILSSIIGGVLSLTVFSFSMVMIVLSQATSSLSPRLLPQLIRDRSHQTTLGLYLGVIMYCYITMVAINPNEEWRLNSFSIFLAVILAILCLSFFVFFIASISRRIQVGEVIKDVHKRAVTDVRAWQAHPEGWSLRAVPEQVEEWYRVDVRESGYVDATLYEELSRLATELKTRMFLEQPRSAYVLRGSVLFRSERPLTNEELKAAAEVLKLADNRDKEFWYLPAIRHITEVAVKAMSPGINDPGTAIEATYLLSDLFLLLPRLPGFNHYHHEEGSGELFFVQHSVQEVIRSSFEQLRTYSKADLSVMTHLFHALDRLRSSFPREDMQVFIREELAALREDGEATLKNSYDRQRFLDLF